MGRMNCARSFAGGGNEPLPVQTDMERTVRDANQPMVLFVVVYVSGNEKSVFPRSHLPKERAP